MIIGVSGHATRNREPFLEISMIIITTAAAAMIMAGRSEFVAGINAPMLEYITRRNSTSSFSAQLDVDGALSMTASGTVELASTLNQPTALLAQLFMHCNPVVVFAAALMAEHAADVAMHDGAGKPA
jgi:hypothetical protein